MHQLENGFTKIANTILEELFKSQIPLNSMRLILWAIRNSYGYNRKKTKPISIRKLGEETEMSISSVHLALQVLIENGVLIKNQDGSLNFDKNKIESVQPTEHPKHKKAFSPLNESVQPTEHPVQPTERKLQPTERGECNYIKENLNKTLVKKERKVFSPPPLEEIRKYCIERKNRVNPEKFHAHYESNGWLVGKNKMKDWKASIRYWEQDNFNEQKQNPGNKAAPIPGKYDHLGTKV